MRRIGIAGLAMTVGAALTLASVGTAGAAITLGSISVTGPGTVDSVYDGAVAFTRYPSPLSGTIIAKTLTGFGDMGVTVAYAPGDTDFSFGDSSSVLKPVLRWG